MQSLQLDDGSETWIRILTKKKKKNAYLDVIPLVFEIKKHNVVVSFNVRLTNKETS